MKKRTHGFTLVEILTTVVILAVVAGLALPSYFSTIEQARTNEAKTNLNIIHMGEKLYFLAEGGYWGPGATTIGVTNTALNVDMTATYYDTISVTASNGVCPPSCTTYTAVLTRNLTQGGDGVSWWQNVYNNTDVAPAQTNGP